MNYAHAQDCDAFAANEGCRVSAFTIRYREMPGDAEREAIEGIVQRCGGRMSWEAHSLLARAYALCEGTSLDVAEIAQRSSGEVLEAAVIACAVLPNVAEALPELLRALGGPGRPAGIVACDPIDGGLIVEWNLDRTDTSVVLGLMDVELRRFHAGRVMHLLSPLPLAWWTRLAADGLRAPQIAPDRVLEALLERSNVAR